MQKRALTYYKKIPKIIKNKYVITIFLFLVWMIFFDKNDLFIQGKRLKDKKDLQTKVLFYKAEIKKIKKDESELLSNDAQLERFAREHYMMKRDSEDIFIIVEK